jgi:hypothetical protein
MVRIGSARNAQFNDTVLCHNVFERSHELRSDLFQGYVNEGIRIVSETIFDIVEMRSRIEESKLVELTQGYFEKAKTILEVDDWRFYVCKTVLALVFQSALGIDLGYDNVYNPPLFTAFKTADWTDATGVQSEKLKAVVQPWYDAGKLSSPTVWDLDEICKRLSKAYSVFSGGDHLLFNCRANIIAALKANYGAEAVVVKNGVLGHNSPVVDSLIYHVLTSNPYNNMITNPEYYETLTSDAFGPPIDNIR